MFSFITKNWRGKPLTSYQVIVELVAATIADAVLAALPLIGHHSHHD